MFGTRSEIEFEPTKHQGLWKEEAVCDILLFGEQASALRFAVALEAGAVQDLAAAAIRARLRLELTRDLENGLPDALSVVFFEPRPPGPAPDSPRRRRGKSKSLKPPASGDAFEAFLRLLTPGSALVATLNAPFDWREDALRRLGYHNLTPHGMCRLGEKPRPKGPVRQRWRRTIH